MKWESFELSRLKRNYIVNLIITEISRLDHWIAGREHAMWWSLSCVYVYSE